MSVKSKLQSWQLLYNPHITPLLLFSQTFTHSVLSFTVINDFHSHNTQPF
uniref:Uncharacterized protein n=1 Tax=Anguilla anguilla TaxID=7936 RepID=A0A0E9Q3W5_ANGAN